MAIQAADHAPIPRAQPVQEAFPLQFKVGSLVASTVLNGIIYSLAAKIFAGFHLYGGGFWFGVAHHLSNRAIDAICLIGNIDPNENTVKIIKGGLQFFGSIAIAALFSRAMGFPISFFHAIWLHICTYGVIIGGVLCIGLAVLTVVGAIGAIVISVRMRRDRCDARQAIENIRNDAIQYIGNMEGNGIRGLDQLRRRILEALQRHQQPQAAERQGCR